MAEAVAVNKIDPLGEIDGINLIGSRFPSLPPDHLAYHQFLQSLPVRNQNLLMEEGNEILKIISEAVRKTTPAETQQNSPIRSKFSKDYSIMQEDNNVENANKGARFGSNLSPEEVDSLPVVMGKINEVSIDIDRIKDPRELFEAFERRKRAEKEVARVTGRPLPKPQRKIRPQKPNIPGLSKVYVYKHRYPIKDSPTVKQDKREEISAKDGSTIKREDEERSEGSAQEKNLSGDLVDSKIKDLEEERELNHLIEQLKVTPFEAEKVDIAGIPEMKRLLVDDVPRIKPMPLSDLQNVLHNNITRRKWKAADSVIDDGPTPPKSPSASLLRRIVRTRKTNACENAFQDTVISDHFEFSDYEKATQDERICPVPENNDESAANLELAPPLHFEFSDNEKSDYEKATRDDTVCEGPENTDINAATLELAPPSQSVSPFIVESSAKRGPIDVPGSCSNGNAEVESSPHTNEVDNASEQKQANKKRRRRNAFTKPRKRAAKSVASDQRAPGPTNDSNNTTSGTSSASEADNHVRNKGQKNKKARNSLAGAGSSIVSGERRSTRIRSKPLQYWKGERFLYGRVHESMVTVIGIKEFNSPGNSSLQVKSFVSDEYRQLLNFAAI